METSRRRAVSPGKGWAGGQGQALPRQPAELQECGVIAVGATPALRRRQLASPAGGQGAAQVIPGGKRGLLGLLARPARPGMLLGHCARHHACGAHFCNRR